MIPTFTHTTYCIVCGVHIQTVCVHVFSVIVYVSLCRGICAGVVKQTSRCIFLSFIRSLTLPLYYSMSTVAMETILLFFSSLLVCVAGKYPQTHTRTSVHTVIVHREAVLGQAVMLHEKASHWVCAHSKTSISTLGLCVSVG